MFKNFKVKQAIIGASGDAIKLFSRRMDLSQEIVAYSDCIQFTDTDQKYEISFLENISPYHFGFLEDVLLDEYIAEIEKHHFGIFNFEESLYVSLLHSDCKNSLDLLTRDRGLVFDEKISVPGISFLEKKNITFITER